MHFVKRIPRGVKSVLATNAFKNWGTPIRYGGGFVLGASIVRSYATTPITVPKEFTGLQIEVIKAGDGKTFPKKGQKVTVHYTGYLVNGSKFDSSVDRKEPFTFTIGVGQVIRGWDDGVMKMSVGESSRIYIKPDFGYGARGAGNVIPPNSTLIFDVELISIK
jgi:FK506-binding protein 1